ncbi:MAG: patatin-like phospholipase family protein, partial [Candidatus Eisenbacteria bacterium]|nr:patatin-like phospholipase family protein [Candidatus Eisenbacteria bacterium]
MSTATVGIALSGGTAKTIAHIGVLEALEDAGIRVTCMTGTSGGAIIGALYAAGFSIPELKALARGVCWNKLARLSFPRLGFLSNDTVHRFLTDLLGSRTFDQLRLPLAIVGTNLLTGERAIFREGSVALAARVSSTIPHLFAPVEIGDDMFVDGGLVEFLPVATLRDAFNPDVRVGVNLGVSGRLPRPRNFIQVSVVVGTVVARQTVRLNEALSDVVIRPDTRLFHPFDLEASQGLIEVGYQGAIEQLPALRDAIRRHDPAFELTPLRPHGLAAGGES